MTGNILDCRSTQSNARSSVHSTSGRACVTAVLGQGPAEVSIETLNPSVEGGEY
jgi:hypothetical protein